MNALCDSCGHPFDAKAAWQRLCWPCWRNRQDHKLKDAGYAAGYTAGYTDGRHAARGDAGSLTPSTLRELVTLCHPDRHPPERYDQANRATALLLGLMDR